MSPGDAAGPALSLARVLAVLGSARADSHTAALLDAVLAGRVVTRIDLRTLDVRPYEYDAPIERDDFAGVVDAMLAHDVILFATPVYWYAMSGRMKTLFDRLSDLVTVRKDLGRRLKGRRVFVLACGSESQLPEGFEVPFRETAAYLEMTWGGSYYARTDAGGILPAGMSGARSFGDRVMAGIDPAAPAHGV